MINGLPTIFGYGGSESAMRSSQDALTGADFRRRASEACFVREVFEGCFEHHVDSALRSRYHADTYAALKMQHGLQTHNRLINDVLDKVCVAWSEGATYTLTTPEGVQIESPEFDAIVKEAGFDNLMKQIDVLTELFPAVCVMPVVRVDDDDMDESGTPGRDFDFIVYSPEWFNAIPADDDPAEMVQLEVYEECWDEAQRAKTLEKYVWGSQTVTKYKMDRQGRWQQDGDPILHGYGQIPAVLFRRSHPLTSLWADTPGMALAMKTVEANCWETMVSYQGSGQVKFLIGEFKGWPQGQVLRHGGVVDAGSAENINVLDLQTDVAGFVNTFISRLRKDAAVMMGLGADEFDATGTPPSGESLKMRYWQRDRRAMQKRSHLVESLKDLWEVSLAVLAVHLSATMDSDGNKVGPIENISALPPPEGVFQVDVHEVTYPELMADRMARVDWELAKGLTSLVAVARADNPDLSDEQAKQRIADNKKTNAELDRAAQPARPTLGSLLKPPAMPSAAMQPKPEAVK